MASLLSEWKVLHQQDYSGLIILRIISIWANSISGLITTLKFLDSRQFVDSILKRVALAFFLMWFNLLVEKSKYPLMRRLKKNLRFRNLWIDSRVLGFSTWHLQLKTLSAD